MALARHGARREALCRDRGEAAAIVHRAGQGRGGVRRHLFSIDESWEIVFARACANGFNLDDRRWCSTSAEEAAKLATAWAAPVLLGVLRRPVLSLRLFDPCLAWEFVSLKPHRLS